LFNTPDLDFYIAAREKLRAGTRIEALHHPGRGAASFFKALCDRMRICGLVSTRMCEVLDRIAS
jgi:hypothetical protein